ncbi:MAG: thioesterase family protein [Actinomycetota bacterium]|nr:thioesterase family protein [Actinomycetota bacterium]
MVTADTPATLEVGTPNVPTSYYRRLPGGIYEPTVHVQGAWNDHEQHMAPVSGLVVHAMEEHEPRDDLQLARVTFEILGVIPREPTEVMVTTIRPGRTIELVEAVLVAGGRPAVRAHAWRMARGDTAAVAGGAPEPLPAPGTWEPWEGSTVWSGGYIGSLEGRRDPASRPGRGRVWLRTDIDLVEGIATSPTAAFVGLVDTANGVLVREDPQAWIFPNIDLSLHLFRRPVGEWVGFDTTVVFGGEGVGLTSSWLYDQEGAVGRAEQILTIRPRPARG